MSGGSMDYLYRKIEYNAVPYIKETDIRNLAIDFANLMHDLEWYKSGDIDKTDWENSARQFRAKWLVKSEGVREAINEMITEQIADLNTVLNDYNF